MSQSMPVLQKTFAAATNLAADQFLFMKMSADFTADLCGDNELAIGTLQNMPAAAGRGAVVRLLGTTKLRVDGATGGGGAAILAGTPLKCSATGLGVKASAAKDVVGAIALQGSTAVGDIIEALLVTYYIVA